MEVEWIATDPDSGLLSHTERRSSVRDYAARIEALLTLGEGYSHVHRAGETYPLLTLSFRGGYGVVHRFPSADKVSLLAGGGAIDASETALVPVMGDDVPFTGEYVLSAERANLRRPWSGPANTSDPNDTGQEPRDRDQGLGCPVPANLSYCHMSEPFAVFRHRR